MSFQTALGLAIKSIYSGKTRKQRGERERDSHIDSFWSNMANRGEVRKMMSDPPPILMYPPLQN